MFKKTTGLTVMLAGVAAAAAVAAAPSAAASVDPSPSPTAAQGPVALPPGGPEAVYPQETTVGGADPYVPFGTDPYVPYGVWAP